jgi:hypothetical protein
MIELLRPNPEVRPQGVPEDPLKVLYVRSYLWLRLGIGLLGLALPIVLWLFDSFLSRNWQLRDSISGYYYSGARESLVGTLSAIAVFLVAHKVAEGNLDNILTIAAGVFAALVALCPTGRPSTDTPLSPLQRRLGESLIERVHYTAAILFLACLGGMCWMFGNVEGRRPRTPGKRSPEFWRGFHHGCSATIGLGLALCLLSLLADWPRLFWPEALCVWAFGLSWTMKGAELDILNARVGRGASARASVEHDR